ncbi:MAG: hypothetical protein GY749_48875, partial [Desulfobacteraceae bacterium]|nr:hypothetical protein [Desulfobacteraceae bacterium]
MNRDNRCKHLCIFLLILISIFLASTLKKTDAIAGESGSVSPYYGSFSTQIPITIPVFHGLEPNLKLVYSSSGSNSWVGIGWSLSGFSVIERSSSGGGTPRYNDDDIFFLDGMELVASTMQGGTHCTKIQNYTRILQDTVNNKWYVWGTNGNKATYEPSYQTSKGIFRWMLSELEDPHGNVVNYDYWCEGTSAATCCYLDTISYNRTVITFYRELRPDPITFATGANLGQINYRLKTIDVQVNGQRARVYKLNYKQSVNTSRSLLSNIQQFGNDAIVDDTSWNVTGETFLPAMTFGWQEGSDGIFDNYTSTGGPGKNIFFADVNGDGRTDLIKHDPASGKVYTFISNDDGSFDNNYSTTEGPGGNKDGYVSFGDVNGDGRTDLVKHDSVGTVYTYLSDGDGTFGSHSTTTGPGGKGAGYVVITDVNGDSRADLIKLDSDAVLYTCLSNGDGTFGDYRITGGQGKNIYFANLNGDAQADLVRRDASTIYAYLSNDDGAFGNYTATDGVDGEIYFADVNGDGRSDLIRHDSGRIYTHLSNGDGTFGGFTITDGIDEKISFADINGDRRADLIKNDSGTIYTYLSNGDGTFESYSISNDGPGEDIYFADVSGDGVNDLIKKDDSNTVYTFLSKEMPDIITSIFNGVGGTSSIEYKPSSYWSNTNLPMVMQTVYKTTTGDGRGNQSATEYRYEGGLWSASERRFLGFRKVSAVLDAQGNYTETYYYQKVGSISKPEVTYFKDNQGQIFRYTLYAYTENTSPPYTSLLTDRWEYECNLSENCMKTLNQFAYDEYGNVIATYEWGDYERDGDERTTVRGYYPNKDLYIAGLPAYENMYEGIVSVSENREIVPISGTGELIQRKLYNYDQNTSFEAPPTKGDATEVLKWNSETGDYVSVKTEYDRWGNAILHFDERDFESTTKFDPVYHIYKEEQCNSLGHCTLMKWDAAMGLLTSNTDVANGTTTWYSYDPLGRPLAKEHPDESLIEYDYLDWGDPNNQRIRKTMPDGTDDGLWTEVYQDGLGRKYKTVKEGGFIKETLFSDATNRVWKESLWYQSEDGPHWIVYSYDGTGRLRTSANPDGTFSEVVYANARNGKPYTASYDELRNEKVVWKDAYGNIAQ